MVASRMRKIDHATMEASDRNNPKQHCNLKDIGHAQGHLDIRATCEFMDNAGVQEAKHAVLQQRKSLHDRPITSQY